MPASGPGKNSKIHPKGEKYSSWQRREQNLLASIEPNGLSIISPQFTHLYCFTETFPC